MGNSLGKSQESSQNFSDIYEFTHESYESYVLHKKTGSVCTLKKIIIHSREEAQAFMGELAAKKSSQCHSISKIIDYYRVGLGQFCSMTFTFFLVFLGGNDLITLQEEFLCRRYMKSYFMESEIMQVMKSLLCALREYHSGYHTQLNQISIDRIFINKETKKMHLEDPILYPTELSHKDCQLVCAMVNYASPQKIDSIYHNKFQQYDDYTSNLYTVGLIGLQLIKMNYLDSLYSHRKSIDRAIIQKQLSSIGSLSLKNGFQVLLDHSPSKRKNIYQIWEISCLKQYRLNRLMRVDSSVTVSTSDLSYAPELKTPTSYMPVPQIIENRHIEKMRNGQYLRVADRGQQDISKLYENRIAYETGENSIKFNKDKFYAGEHDNRNQYHPYVAEKSIQSKNGRESGIYNSRQQQGKAGFQNIWQQRKIIATKQNGRIESGQIIERGSYLHPNQMARLNLSRRERANSFKVNQYIAYRASRGQYPTSRDQSMRSKDIRGNY